MFVFLLQVRHAVVEGGPLYLFAVFSAIVWALWVVKVVLSRRYEPWREPYETTTSVLVPVVDEPVDLFRDVLRRIVAQRPTETIVVINGARNHALEEVCAEFADDGVVWTWTPIPSKRNAVNVGTELASGEILVLVDSDTVWTRDTLCELVKPFADPGIGGVTTRQRVLDPQRHFFTRWADWLENSRVKYSMPAQSVLGHVGCLPGRTIAFRRQIVVKAMDEFMHGRFLGVFLEISDDRTLTNLALKQGYPHRVPVDVPRVHRRTGHRAEALQAAAAVGARVAVQHPSHAAVDGAPRTGARGVLRLRHRASLPAPGSSHRWCRTRRERHWRQLLHRLSPRVRVRLGHGRGRRVDRAGVRVVDGDPTAAPPRGSAGRLVADARVRAVLVDVSHAHPPHRVLPDGPRGGLGHPPRRLLRDAGRRHRRARTRDRAGPDRHRRSRRTHAIRGRRAHRCPRRPRNRRDPGAGASGGGRPATH